MRLILASAAALLMCGCQRNPIVTHHPDEHDDIYYLEIPQATAHGICSHLHEGSDGRWYIEKPTGFNPATQMSVSTELKEFATEKEAVNWIADRCPNVTRK